MQAMGIYYILNRQTGRIYIGAAQHIQSRWRGHLSDLESGTHVNPDLQADWIKYGEGAFSLGIVEELDDDAPLSERERYWIEEYRKTNIVYNLRIPDKERRDEKVTVSFTLNRENDADILAWLNSQENKSQAIRELIREHAIGRVTLFDVYQAIKGIDRQVDRMISRGSPVIMPAGTDVGQQGIGEPPDVAATLDNLGL